jgi:hypothetical protein
LTWDRDLDAEIDDHLQRLTDRYVHQGLSLDDAVAQLRESQRHARGVVLVEQILRDLSWAVRLVRTRPAFASTAIFVLALGLAGR